MKFAFDSSKGEEKKDKHWQYYSVLMMELFSGSLCVGRFIPKKSLITFTEGTPLEGGPDNPKVSF